MSLFSYLSSQFTVSDPAELELRRYFAEFSQAARVSSPRVLSCVDLLLGFERFLRAASAEDVRFLSLHQLFSRSMLKWSFTERF